MPTARPRHMVTETPEVTAALASAARRWPQISSRGALLARLAVEGAHLLEDGAGEAVSRRRAAIGEHEGEFAELYDAAGSAGGRA